MDYQLSQSNIYIISPTIIYFISIFLVLLMVLWLTKRIFKDFIQKSKYFDHIIYLVRLPKERPGDETKEPTTQEIREDISVGETIFASIGGLRAQRGLRAWLFGRNDHFSFEVVASKKKIAFYVVAPREMGRYIEQQISAHYPSAVIEEVDDYNIFKPNSEIVAGFLKTRRSFIYPIKTYQNHETDPMNSIINVLSKLDDEEGIAIQYVVRSARPFWHRTIRDITSNIRRGKSLQESISIGTRNKIFSVVLDIIKLFISKPKEEQFQQNSQIPRLTAMEEEMLKGIESKNGKAGLDVNLRIVVSAKTPGKASVYLNNLGNAFAQFNHYEYGNSFSQNIKTSNHDKIINSFIYRRYDRDIGFLLNTEELASLYHLPLKTSETPNILWLNAKYAPAPADTSATGIILGANIYRGVKKDIQISRDDRRRHMYVVGKSGGGKSMFMANMAVQDILNGEGVCVLDPHGDLIEDIITRVPAERAEDVILFAPADTERPLALNLLSYDPNYPEQKTFVINELIKIFDKLYDLKATGGPIFEQYMRNALLLIMSDPASGSTLMEVPKVLADPDFRRMKLEKCSDPTVVDFWRKEAEKAGGDAALANVVPYVTSKLTQFISNDTMRPIIGQQESSFNFREVMDKKKILLIDLSKGQVGEMNAYLLGMIIIGKILMAALSRTDIPREKRTDFYLYIDEFQNFTTDSICSILSEARKYGLNLTMAHQYLGQLSRGQDTSIKDAVFGNVGTWILFKIGSEDAEVLEKEFSPVFNKYDLINIEKYTTYVRLLINNTSSRPFSMSTPWPLSGVENPAIAAKIKALSRFKYGQDRRLIEAEIRKRTKI